MEATSYHDTLHEQPSRNDIIAFVAGSVGAILWHMHDPSSPYTPMGYFVAAGTATSLLLNKLIPIKKS